jgi:DNA-directed RNA polymerase subunit M/transcription elongation factor TFIIS
MRLIDRSEVDPSITCERCDKTGGVYKTLTTSMAQYWRCSFCGHVWAIEKAGQVSDIAEHK